MTVEKVSITQSLRLKRSDLISGGISGLLTGMILAVISVPANYFLLLYFSSDIQRFFNGYEPTVSGVIGISIGTFVLIVCVGIIYSLFHDFLPGKTGFTKVLIFGILIFIATALNDYLIDYHVSTGLFYSESLVDVALLLVLLPFFMARFFDRFRV